MDPQMPQDLARQVWALARRQHWVVTREQLLGLGVHQDAIKHRASGGRLHRVHTGVYAVGRRDLTRYGELAAAVLACGGGAVLSHRSTAELWGLGLRGRVEVTVPAGRTPKRPGIKVHRRDLNPAHTTRRHNIPVTSVAQTLLDMASYLPKDHLERAVNEADRLNVIDPEQLRRALDGFAWQTGVSRLRTLLDLRTFTLTDSQLERRFKPIAKAAGLPPPLTQVPLNGYRVDFYWPDLGLVVETDGLRYHRTPAQQARAHLRDQAHSAAGLLPLRFTHGQVAHDRSYVIATLRKVTAQRSRLVNPARAAKPSSPT